MIRAQKVLTTLAAGFGGAALALRFRDPAATFQGWRAVPLLGATAFAFLSLAMILMVIEVRRGRAHPLRLAIPALIVLQGSVSLSSAGRLSAPLLTTLLVVEVAILIGLLVAVWRWRKAKRGLLEDRLSELLSLLVPEKLARLAAVEIVLVTAVLSAPFRRPRRNADQLTFSYSENSRLRPVIVAGPLLLFVEGIVVHQWLGPERFWLRVGHVVVCVYATLWLWGAYALMRSRPHRIDEEQLWLHRGVWGHLRVPLQAVASVHKVSDDAAPGPFQKIPEVVSFTVKGVDKIELTLQTPVTGMGMLEPMKPGRRIFLSADDASGFCRAVEGAAERRRRLA